jgi:hypothetical protein
MVMDVNKYPIYRRRNTGHTLLVHGIELDNRWVVLQNVYLSTKYDAHINVEVCYNIRAVKYLFKYVYKGHDRVTVEISCQNNNATEGNVVEADEIKKYLDCRYVFASEAMWHIFKFDMHEWFIAIERLQYHLPNQQMVLFDDHDDVQEMATWSTISKTMLKMVQNKPRIGSCMKPYVRSIPLAMGVELEVEAMDNAQERLCHWSHVLCTPDIG